MPQAAEFGRCGKLQRIACCGEKPVLHFVLSPLLDQATHRKQPDKGRRGMAGLERLVPFDERGAVDPAWEGAVRTTAFATEAGRTEGVGDFVRRVTDKQ